MRQLLADIRRRISGPPRRQLTPQERLACIKTGARHGVRGTVHPKDWIFWFLYDLQKSAAIESYFDDGRDSAQKLRDWVGSPATLLEFASGYGRVTRHLRNVMPETAITACDIHPEAVNFLREDLGVHAVGSAETPEKFKLGRQFDVVFALSFFSHMPRSSWTRWLHALADHTKPGGFLIFTTHGERTRPNAGDPYIGADGFWFRRMSEQKDLSQKAYGCTITLPHYVRQQIARMPGFELVRFKEGFWWGHQDVYVLKRQV